MSEKKKTVKEGGKGKCLFQELLAAFGKCSGKLSFQKGMDNRGTDACLSPLPI